ncbi:DegT/DnrJ/EryC1/StrS family aminotransferase [Paenibacillus cymbidii]|uniref:DegT/DnrJ/EryC1/StrS family aminotransferase n=1 Tax=Paenibacillus cymbidii TaxID=1639034 RepID=UPI00108042DB|nr:DegT/DnrJ/EryC1/StrS family aminotransferase [Paenibacillus cymbidii]
MGTTQALASRGGAPVRTAPFPAWPVFGELEERLVLEALRSGKWGGVGRDKLVEVEEAFARLHDAKYAVSVANGTIAITLALKAAGVGPGDEVIMPPYTFVATATSALLFGAIPVFADVEADTLLLDPERVEEAITPRTKAIVAVHIAGAPANMDRLGEIAARRGLALIEDAAQAVGARWNGIGVGAIGDAGTFSFQSSKNLNSGEGGMIVTNREDIADLAWSYANAGRVREGAWYQHENVGWNFRLTELQAALLLAQMTRLGEQMATRERNASLLDALLADVAGVCPMKRDPRITEHAHHLYMFRVAPELARAAGGKAELVRHLQAEGIPAASGYVPLSGNQAVLAEIGKLTGTVPTFDCPVCDNACENEAIWLTQNVLLAGEADMHDVARAVRKVTEAL